MADNTTDYYKLRTSRPDHAIQLQQFQATPKGQTHKPYEDQLAILVCQIKIWNAKTPDWFTVPAASSCTTLRECESVEVTDSAKELINKAVVRFPRGTVIKLRSNKSSEVKTGDKADQTDSKDTLQNATNDGEVTTPQSASYSDNNVSTTSMAVNYDDKGLINFNRSKNEPALLNPNDVAIGNRIEIRLGYAYSETEFKEMNETDHTDNSKGMDVVFTGFITAASVTTPIELECTNMAHILTAINTPNMKAKAMIDVKDFLDEDGTYHLLKDTGIELAECSKKSTIQVSGGSISNNLTVADILTEWNKAGVLCLMDTDRSTGKVQLRVGLTYYAGSGGGNLPNNDKKYITYNGGDNSTTLLQFDWDVAQDKLSLKRNDKKYLAVEAFGRTKTQMFKFTIRKNPDSDDEGWMTDASGQWDVVNERELVNRKTAKFEEGVLTTKKINNRLKNPIDMSNYTVIPYMSTKIGITKDALMEEAKQYWAKYNPNGISGSIVIFGDIFIKPTQIVGLIDRRQPEKDGYYYVESVNTTFGLDGYRRELKMPFKVASFKGQVEFIE